MVELREVTRENVTPVCKLKLAPGQETFVAPTAVTLAQAQFDDKAIVRAIYSNDEVVGLVAVAFDEDDYGWYLWRLMIDADHQRRGYGGAAVELALGLVREQGASEILTSYVPGEGAPVGFYEKLGFEETGQEVEGERIMRRAL